MTAANLPQALYQAVLDDPDNDAPRLACASWCEQNGQPQRARFIRLQCEMEHLPQGDPRRWQSQSECYSLFWRHRKEWLGKRPDGKGVKWQFLRGFPDQVEFDSFTALEANRAAVFRFPVRRLSFGNLRSIARLANCDALDSVRELDLSRCNLRDQGARVLAASPHLRNVTWLNLGGNEIGPEGIAALVGSASLTSLTYLEIDSRTYHSSPNPIGPAGAQALAGWPALARLRYLGLNRAGIGDEGIAALAGSPHLGQLTHIELGVNGLTRAGMAALADAACWPALRSLTLTGNRLGDEGAGELARARHWTVLNLLDLASCHIGDPGAAALARAPLDSLIRLVLSNNAIGNAGAKALAGSSRLGNLQALELGGNLIGDDGGWALGRSEHLRSLRTISLVNNAMQGALVGAVQDRYSLQNPARLDNVELRAAPTVPANLAPPPPLPQTNAPADEDGLWQAIVDDPDDDLPRLVYADWLEENHQPARAELIRLQCAPRRQTVSQREKELIETNRADWLGPLHPFAETVRFERGLMRIVMSMRSFFLNAFQKNGADWLRQTRTSGLELWGTTKDWNKVAGSPVLAAVHELWLSGNPTCRGAIPALAGSPHLDALHTFHLDSAGIGRAYLGELMSGDRLPRLRRLRLGGAGVRLDHLQALVRWPGTARLSSLALPGNWLGPAEVSVLAGSPTLAGLRILELTNNRVGDNGVRALAESPHLSNLTRLDLGTCHIGIEGALALANSPLLERLESLSLINNLITDEGALALAGSPRLGQLQTLWLSQRGLSDECVAEVRRLMGERLVLQMYRGGW